MNKQRGAGRNSSRTYSPGRAREAEGGFGSERSVRKRKVRSQSVAEINVIAAGINVIGKQINAIKPLSRRQDAGEVRTPRAGIAVWQHRPQEHPFPPSPSVAGGMGAVPVSPRGGRAVPAPLGSLGGTEPLVRLLLYWRVKSPRLRSGIKPPRLGSGRSVGLRCPRR